MVDGDELHPRPPEPGVDVEVVGGVLAHLHQLALHLGEVHGRPVRGLVGVAGHLLAVAPAGNA